MRVLAFAAVAALLTITPGADVALVLRTAVATGRRNALLAGLGVCSGLVGWGLATALGVSALLAASTAAYTTLRIVGATYLVYLGVRTLLASRHHSRGTTTDPAPGSTRPARLATGRRAYTTGLACNLLNPKVGAFYVTFLPQFLPADAPPLPTTMLYVAIHATEAVVWLGVVAVTVDRARDIVTRPAVRRRLERLTGLVLVGFGLRLALDTR